MSNKGVKYKFYNAYGTTSNNPYPYASFKDYWEKRTKVKATECVVCQSSKSLDGAHVHTDNYCQRGNRRKMYITILCGECQDCEKQLQTVEYQWDPLEPISNQKCTC